MTLVKLERNDFEIVMEFFCVLEYMIKIENKIAIYFQKANTSLQENLRSLELHFNFQFLNFQDKF